VAAYATASLVDGDAWKLLLGLAAGLLGYSLLAGRWLIRVGGTLRAMYWRPDQVSEAATRLLADAATVPTEQLAMRYG
jgi:hypothetical protein